MPKDITTRPDINERSDAGGLANNGSSDSSSQLGGGLSAVKPNEQEAQATSSQAQQAVSAPTASNAKEDELARKREEALRRKAERDRQKEEREKKYANVPSDEAVYREMEFQGLDPSDPEDRAAFRKKLSESSAPKVEEAQPAVAHGMAAEIADEFIPPVANSLEEGGEVNEPVVAQTPQGIVDLRTGELYDSVEDYAAERSPEKTGVNKKKKSKAKPKSKLGKSLDDLIDNSEGKYADDPILTALGNNLLREVNTPEQFNSEPVDKRLLGYTEARELKSDKLGENLGHKMQVDKEYKTALNKARKVAEKKKEEKDLEEELYEGIGEAAINIADALAGVEEAVAEQQVGQVERELEQEELDAEAADIVDEALTGNRISEENNPKPEEPKDEPKKKGKKKKRSEEENRFRSMTEEQLRAFYRSGGRIPWTDISHDAESVANGDFFRSEKQKRLDKILEDWENFKKWYVQCDIPLEGDEIYVDEESGEVRRRRSRQIQENMVAFAVFLSERCETSIDPRDPVFQTFYNITASKHLGICFDTNGNFMGAKEGEKVPEIPDLYVVAAIESIMKNIENGVHPHMWNLQDIRIGGTKCYPMPVMTQLEMMYYTAMNRGYNEKRLIEGAKFIWNNQILYDLREGENKAQIRALETNMSFLLDHVGIEDTRSWGIPSIKDRPLYEQLEDWVIDGDYKVWGPDTEEYTRAAFERQRRVLLDASQTRHAPIGPDGEYLSPEDIRDNYAVVALENAANFMAFSSIFADVMLTGSNAVEAVKGNVWHMAGNKLRMAPLAEDERPTDYLYSIARTKEAREFLEAINLVNYAVGGDAQWVYLQETPSPTVANAEAWIRAKYGSVKGGKATQILKRLSRRMHAIQSGEWITRRSDATLLIENYLINQHATRNANAISAAVDGSVKKTVTGVMLDEAVRGSRLEYGDAGINRAFRDMMLDVEGQNAYHMMKQRTMGGQHITTAKYSKWALKHTTEANLMRIFCSPFMEFAIESAVRLNPLMNTTQWLTVARAAKKNGKAVVGEDGTITKEKVTWEQLRRGGEGMAEQEYACYLASTQLMENLKLDAMRFGGTFVESVIFCLAATMLLGIAHDPDDDRLRFNWDEIIFGAEYDENGNRIEGTGVAFSVMWYLHDIFGAALPMAVAMATFMQNRDMKQAVAITIDGMFDIFDGTMPGKIARLATDWREEVLQAQALVATSGAEDSEDWMVEPENLFDYATTLMKVGLLDFVTDVPNIRIFESIINGGMNDDDYAVNPFKKWDDDHENLVAVTDYTEQRLRILCSNNWLAGVVMNLFTGFYFQDEEKPYKTGYTSFDQPYATVRDIVQTACYEKTKDVTMEVGEDGKWTITSDDETTMNTVMWIMGILDKCESPQYAAENAVCISSGARYATISYCYNEIGLLYDQYYDALNNYSGARDSAFYQWKQEKYEEMEQAQAYFYAAITKLSDWDIPDYPQEYYQFRTNFQKVYTTEDGDVTNGFVWQARNLPVVKEAADVAGIPNVNVEYIKYGDFNDPLQLIASPIHSEGTGYDWQTLCAWQGECTDPEFINDMIGDAVLDYTVNKGEKVLDVATGYGNTTNEVGDTHYVIGERAYVPVDQELRYDYKVDPTTDDLWVPEGSQVSQYYSSDNESGSGSSAGSGSNSSYYSGSYSSGYSSSSSSYTPKIYYTSRSVSADKAASMYAKNPYTASTTYLRPSFYTKGSREAYRRQDM